MTFTQNFVRRNSRATATTLLALALTLSASACSSSEGQPAAGASISDSAALAGSDELMLGSRDIATVVMEPMPVGITITGSLDAAERVDIKAELSGSVDRVMAERGTAVARGQVLATIDPGATAAQLVSAEAALASASRDLRAADTLYKRGAVAERDFMQARVARDAAAAQVAQVRNQLSRSRVVSPISGSVSEKIVEAGEAVQIGTRLFTLVNTRMLELTARVAPADVGSLQVGQLVHLFLDAYPGRVVVGRVHRIPAVAEAGTRQVPVTVRVANADRALVAGLFATGTIITTGSVAPVLIVPASAVVDQETVPAVFAIDGGRVVRTAVTLGARDHARGLVEVRSGLTQGARVIVNPDPSLRDGLRVTLLADSTISPAAGTTGGMR